jgi:hypothetical protein
MHERSPQSASPSPREETWRNNNNGVSTRLAGSGGPPRELIDRVRQGLDARGYYVLGKDDLSLLGSNIDAHFARERALRDLAESTQAELLQGWSRNVAVIQRT